jgi:hypothetical protein
MFPGLRGRQGPGGRVGELQVGVAGALVGHAVFAVRLGLAVAVLMV